MYIINLDRFNLFERRNNMEGQIVICRKCGKVEIHNTNSKNST